MAATYDWSKFMLRIDIQASKEAIYDAWTSPEIIDLWFLRKLTMQNSNGIEKDCFGKFEPGDTYQWWWYGHSDEIMETGTIIEANGSDSMAFTFGKAGDCYISIYEEMGENILELRQLNIPTDEQSMHEFHLGCKVGWSFFLANLKSILEGGSDLRNKNENLKRMANS